MKIDYLEYVGGGGLALVNHFADGQKQLVQKTINGQPVKNGLLVDLAVLLAGMFFGDGLSRGYGPSTYEEIMDGAIGYAFGDLVSRLVTKSSTTPATTGYPVQQFFPSVPVAAAPIPVTAEPVTSVGNAGWETEY